MPIFSYVDQTSSLTSALSTFALTNCSERELAQWRSPVSVKPSPLKTCPKWPLHAAQTISIRLVPSSSTLWTIAPS